MISNWIYYSPAPPLATAINLGEESSQTFDLFCLFNSLPFPESATRKQCRTVSVKTVYTLPGTNVEVVSVVTHQIPCCLPFRFTTKLVPRAPQTPEQDDQLLVHSPCYVDLELECPLGDFRPSIDELDVIDVVVEPGSAARVITSQVEKKKVSVLPSQQRLRGGDRLGLGFEIAATKVTTKAVLGCVAVTWVRANCATPREHSTMYIPLPCPRIDFAQLHFEVTTLPADQDKTVGVPFYMVINLANCTEIAQQLDLTIQDASSFFHAGSTTSHVVLPPMESSQVCITLVPLKAGNMLLPTVAIESKRLMSKFTVPSPAEAKLFVAPTLVNA